MAKKPPRTDGDRLDELRQGVDGSTSPFAAISRADLRWLLDRAAPIKAPTPPDSKAKGGGAGGKPPKGASK